MRRDADEIKVRLAAQNQADGPQFFINEDPRLTSIGRISLPSLAIAHMAIIICNDVTEIA